jgi:hypothetical protein
MMLGLPFDRGDEARAQVSGSIDLGQPHFGINVNSVGGFALLTPAQSVYLHLQQ